MYVIGEKNLKSKRKRNDYEKQPEVKEYYHVSVKPTAECQNPSSYGVICVRCGQCGKRFDR